MDWTGVAVSAVSAAVAGSLGYGLRGRREGHDRLRQFKVLQLDQTLEYLLACTQAALTVLALDPSEEPFDKLRAARGLPWRSPMALPSAGGWVELLELAGRYANMSRDELLALSDEERRTASERLVLLKVVTMHEAAQRRTDVLA